MEQEKRYSELLPTQLNTEFHRLLELISAVQISMLGAIMDSESTEMTDDEHAVYYEMLQSLGRTAGDIGADLGNTTKEIFIQQAKGAAARERRMTYGATLLVKLESFIPFVQGTDSFKEYIRREIRRSIRDGISNGGKDHWLYGDELGGIFHPDSVEKIEERSFQIFNQDIHWYGLDPLLIAGRIFEADYDNDPEYRNMVDLGRKWKTEFNTRYKRSATNMYGHEIQTP